MKSWFMSFGAIFIFIGSVLCFIVTHGIVVSKSWEWFFVPLGLPDIGFFQAAGISAFISLLTTTTPGIDNVKLERKDKIKRLISIMSRPWGTFALLYLIKCLM